MEVKAFDLGLQRAQRAWNPALHALGSHAREWSARSRAEGLRIGDRAAVAGGQDGLVVRERIQRVGLRAEPCMPA